MASAALPLNPMRARPNAAKMEMTMETATVTVVTMTEFTKNPRKFGISSRSTKLSSVGWRTSHGLPDWAEISAEDFRLVMTM